jgi:hypothetical protein
MSNLKRHIGRIRNTDRRCVVVYMQIPGKTDHALVVDTDALPDSLHDALQEVVQSHEGQSTVALANLLSRRIVPHLGVDIMNVLHARGSLQAVPVDNVVMYPSPNSPYPLRSIIEMMGGQGAADLAQSPVDPTLQNRHTENHKAAAQEEQIAVAMNLIHQANDMASQAQRKREEAYRIAPSLRPAENIASQLGLEVTGLAETFAPAPETVTTQVMDRPSEVVTPTELFEDFAPVSFELSPEAIAEAAELGIDLTGEVARAEAAQQTAVEVLSEVFHSEHDNYDQEDEVDASATNAVEITDDKLQEFLDRAAFRADREAGIAAENAEPKRPVGRPRKDGSPAGSKVKAKAKAKG